MVLLSVQLGLTLLDNWVRLLWWGRAALSSRSIELVLEGLLLGLFGLRVVGSVLLRCHF